MSSLSSIAARNVARNRRRSLVTLAAVLLGVTAVLVLRGFIDGFIRLMVDDIVQGQTGALQVHTAGYMDSIDALPLEPNIPYDEALLARIRAVPGVTGVTGRIQFSGLVSNGVSQTMFVGRGLDMVTEKQAVPRAGFDVLPGGRALGAGDHAQVHHRQRAGSVLPCGDTGGEGEGGGREAVGRRGPGGPGDARLVQPQGPRQLDGRVRGGAERVQPPLREQAGADGAAEAGAGAAGPGGPGHRARGGGG